MSNFISSRDTFDKLTQRLLSKIDLSKRWPENIFDISYCHFAVLDVNYFIEESFYTGLLKYLDLIEEEQIILHRIDSLPGDQLNSENHKIISINITDRFENYEEILFRPFNININMSSYFEVCHLGALESSKKNWCCLLSRDWEVGIFAFTSEEEMIDFKLCFPANVIFVTMLEQLNILAEVVAFSEEGMNKYLELSKNHDRR